jgi:hypothetical protein
MTRTAAFDLAAEVADAHASTTVAAAGHLDVSFSSGGLAFAAKRHPQALARVEARLDPLRQQLSLTAAPHLARQADCRVQSRCRSPRTGLIASEPEIRPAWSIARP